MFFLGDICYPFQDYLTTTVECNEIFVEPSIANLEGDIIFDNEIIPKKKNMQLYCYESVIKFLKILNVKAVTLANNHITDCISNPERTKTFLNDRGILSFGAGNSPHEASLPKILKIEEGSYILFAFGWEAIQSSVAKKNKPGVNPLTTKNVLSSLESARKNHPDKKIILFFHWNYELELYPQPAHRQLAFTAIDNGADAIIGHHPHVVSGIEFYKGSPIIYSLGNWFLPQTCYFEKKLKYPEVVRKQCAVKWNGDIENMKIFWFYYNPEDHRISFLNEELVKDSEEIKKLTPFSGLSHKDYIEWFKKNRVKRKWLPIYKYYDKKFVNWCFDKFVLFRQKFILLIKDVGQ